MDHKSVDELVDALVDHAEADIAAEHEEDDGSDLMDGVQEVGFAAAAMFRATLGDEASASATVMTDDGMVRVTVTITEVD